MKMEVQMLSYKEDVKGSCTCPNCFSTLTETIKQVNREGKIDTTTICLICNYNTIRKINKIDTDF